MSSYIAVKIEHGDGNDTGGNPRRGWLVYERPDDHHYTGPCLAFIEEGYRGDGRRSALAEVYGEHVDVVCVLAVTGREWARARRVQRDERDKPHLKAHGSACQCYRFDADWQATVTA